MQSERLAIGPLNQRDIERVAELLLRGLARRPASGRMDATRQSSDEGTPTATRAEEPHGDARLRPVR
jgi:hypothetical protein